MSIFTRLSIYYYYYNVYLIRETGQYNTRIIGGNRSFPSVREFRSRIATGWGAAAAAAASKTSILSSCRGGPPYCYIKRTRRVGRRKGFFFFFLLN